MQTLYFIRHGETTDNTSGRWGNYDTPLSDVGRSQATAAGRAAKTEGLHFDLIIASPQPRALETAELIAAELGYPKDAIDQMDTLVERRMGKLDNVLYDDFFTEGKVYKDLDDVPGVETVEAMQQRAAEALATIKAHPESAILVVSHGAFGRAFRRTVLGIPYTDEYTTNRPHDMIPNATIAKLI